MGLGSSAYESDASEFWVENAKAVVENPVLKEVAWGGPWDPPERKSMLLFWHESTHKRQLNPRVFPAPKHEETKQKFGVFQALSEVPLLGLPYGLYLRYLEREPAGVLTTWTEFDGLSTRDCEGLVHSSGRVLPNTVVQGPWRYGPSSTPYRVCITAQGHLAGIDHRGHYWNRGHRADPHCRAFYV